MATLTTRETLRMLIKDQTVGSYLFTDDELDALLSLNYDDVLMAAADACFSLACDANKMNLAVKYGNYSKDARGIAREYRRLAEDYKKRAEEAPAIGVAAANATISTLLEIQ